MEYDAAEVKVGVVVIAGLIIFVGFIAAIVGVNWDDDTKEYHTFLQSIPGIVEGSLVKFGGMDVGSVTEIKLPQNIEGGVLIELKLKVDKLTPVKTNSAAYVASIGIMTNKHIEISPGTPDAGFLPSGGLLPGKEVLSLTQMAEPFGEMAGRLTVLVKRFTDVFNDSNRAHMSSIIKNLDRMVLSGSDQFVKLTYNLEKMTANLADVSKGLNELLTKNKNNFDETLVNLEQTTRETGFLISELRTSLAKMESMISANGSSVIEIMENFQFASQNLEEFTRAVKERPWLLVRKAAPPEREIP